MITPTLAEQIAAVKRGIAQWEAICRHLKRSDAPGDDLADKELAVARAVLTTLEALANPTVPQAGERDA